MLIENIPYKNPKTIHFPVEGRFFAIVDPSTKDSLRLLLKDQLDLFLAIDGKKNIKDLANLSKKDPKLVIQFLNVLKDANLINFNSPPPKKPAITQKYLNIWVHITDNCNLRCKYCFVSTLDTFKTIEKKTMYKILDKLLEEIDLDKDLKMIHLKLSGGEVFSKFDFWKSIIKEYKYQIEKKGVKASIVALTNLTILNDEILDYLKKMDIGVGVSLDGLKEFHDKNRVFINQKGTFKKVIKNLLKLKENGIGFSISSTITNESIKGLEEFSKFLVQNKFPFRYTNVKGEFVDKEKFNYFYDKAYKVFEEAIQNGYNFQQNYNQCDLTINTPDGNICGMGKFGGAIYLDGDIYFCHTHFGKKEPLGSIFEKERLSNILKRGEKYWPPLSKECKNCPYELVCSGGCPIYRTQQKSYFCDFYKSNLPKVYKLLAKQKLKIGLQKRAKKQKRKFIVKKQEEFA